MRYYALKFIFLFAFIVALPACEASEPNRDTVRIKTAAGEEMVFYVEIARTPAEKQKGLMGRSVLPEDAGMLFFFDDEAQRTFWMKNTLIPLDMIFVRSDGTIDHIHSMAKPQDLTHITSGAPARAVFEINGGLSDKFGIQAGDKLISPLFKNTAIK